MRGLLDWAGSHLRRLVGCVRTHPLLAALGAAYVAGLTLGAVNGGAQATATYLVATGASLAWWFVWMYRKANWRQYREGRHVMQFTLMVAIILTLAAEVRLFGPYPGIQYVACVLYAWLVWLLASRINLMLRANRARR